MNLSYRNFPNSSFPYIPDYIRREVAQTGQYILPSTLDDAALYGLPGDVVRTIEPNTEAHPVGILLQLLTMYGNIIGNGPHFRAEADIHPAKIFGVLVGRTGKGRKGVAFGHVRSLFERIQPCWVADCLTSGLSSGEGLVYAVRDPIPSAEDPGVEDKRLLVVESEFAVALKMAGRDGNVLTATIRQAWDGGNLNVMNKNSPVKSTGAHISIIGHISKDELLRYMNSTEAANGFANRFLWVLVNRVRILPEGGNIDSQVLDQLSERLKNSIAFAKTVTRIERDEAARVLWAEIYPELSEGKPGLLGAVTSRAEAQVMRLAMIYALMDSASVIRTEHLNAALALWRYCEESAEIIFGGMLGDPVADRIYAALETRPDGLTRTEIRDLFQKNQPASRIDAALALLKAAYRADVSQEATSGRPVERWTTTYHHHHSNQLYH